MNQGFRLKEHYAHWWWLCVVLWAFLVAPLFTVLATDHYQGLTNLGLSLLVPIAVFPFLPCCLATLRRTLSPKGSRAPRWPGFGGRFLILLYGLVCPELLGWVIWFGGTIVAVSSALNSKQQGATFLAILNSASPDFARATVIGLIVIFFTQILTRYQLTADQVERAADAAHDAATKAKEAILAGMAALPKNPRRDRRVLEALRTLHSNEEARKYCDRIATLLQRSEFAQTELRKSFRDLVDGSLRI